MSYKKNLDPELLSELVAESLRNRFVVMPNVPLSQDEARCYFDVTNATLKLNSALVESMGLNEVTNLIKIRNELLKNWQSKFNFKYPI